MALKLQKTVKHCYIVENRNIWPWNRRARQIVLSATIFASKFLTFYIQYLIFEYSKKRFDFPSCQAPPVK